jgi:hypothetical protein
VSQTALGKLSNKLSGRQADGQRLSNAATYKLRSRSRWRCPTGDRCIVLNPGIGAHRVDVISGGAGATPVQTLYSEYGNVHIAGR